jgi:hypothetical protein
MFQIGNKIEFIVELPIGNSGICTGEVGGILPPRNEEEGVSFMITDIIDEDGDAMGDFRMDTSPDGAISDGTQILKVF